MRDNENQDHVLVWHQVFEDAAREKWKTLKLKTKVLDNGTFRVEIGKDRKFAIERKEDGRYCSHPIEGEGWRDAVFLMMEVTGRPASAFRNSDGVRMDQTLRRETESLMRVWEDGWFWEDVWA